MVYSHFYKNTNVFKTEHSFGFAIQKTKNFCRMLTFDFVTFSLYQNIYNILFSFRYALISIIVLPNHFNLLSYVNIYSFNQEIFHSKK